LRTCDSDSAAHAAALEPAYGLHDRRAFERAALRGRLLRLGAPRHGKFLGISGSLALAGRFDFRYGDLSHAVRGLPDAHVPMVSTGKSRMVGSTGGGDCVRSFEYCRRESCFADVTVAVFRLVSTLRCNRNSGA